ncbi:MAG: single-stranded-DNA-specific exonuclease RecJ [Clostridia bacterium]|nr:single-stranded-DNA-specific exonuclease RecJ [Clostridia bacterium]
MQFIPRSAADFTPLGSLPGWLSALLRSRGVDTEEKAYRFLNPDLSGLQDPFLLSGMEETVRLIRHAVASRERIMIFGDYDADGVCATSILLETLTGEGASVSFRLPDRRKDGYGLNESAVREISEKASLLITVDCGISSMAEVALAKSLGLTVIVTDHHQLPEVLPEADAILNPLIGNYPCPYLCGAGVALKICQALQGMEGVQKRLDLAAIATVADVVPLLEENRIIVREGLKRIQSTGRPGLKALLDVAGTSAPVQADALAFRIGPRLNAAGRLGDASLCVQLLLTGKPEKAADVARQLEEMNRRRQNMEHEITDAAFRSISESMSPEDRVLIAAGEGWNPGLIGLSAGKICEKYYRPAIVLSLPEDGGPAVGSCRSIPGVHIFEMLQACSDLLVRFGGHAQAAGLTVEREKIPALREKLNRVIRESCDESVFVPRQEYDLELPFRNWTPETLKELDLLEPTGCGNPPPVFLLSGASVQSMRRVGRDLSHLQLSLVTPENTLVRGIAFFMGEEAEKDHMDVDLLYRPVRNEFNGRVSVEAQVSALRASV